MLPISLSQSPALGARRKLKHFSCPWDKEIGAELWPRRRWRCGPGHPSPEAPQESLQHEQGSQKRASSVPDRPGCPREFQRGSSGAMWHPKRAVEDCPGRSAAAWRAAAAPRYGPPGRASVGVPATPSPRMPRGCARRPWQPRPQQPPPRGQDRPPGASAWQPRPRRPGCAGASPAQTPRRWDHHGAVGRPSAPASRRRRGCGRLAWPQRLG
mmetsp:Transcript_54138/g.150219  ORF Transcript_54138/g.150219 Transcript_54138/m.150219 type:complete len:212 (+) Transcript_54138:69-704(+)